jgi:hypothetical protein
MYIFECHITREPMQRNENEQTIKKMIKTSLYIQYDHLEGGR